MFVLSVPELLLLPSMDEFTIVENDLRFVKYPDSLTKGEKANVRRKCHNNFLFESGLYSAIGERGVQAKQRNPGESQYTSTASVECLNPMIQTWCSVTSARSGSI